MRILIVTARYLPHTGGVAETARSLAKQFQQAGHDVHVVTNRYPRALVRDEHIENVPVTRLQFLIPHLTYLDTGRLDLFFGGLIFLPSTCLELARLILRFKPNVVHLHYLGSPALFLWLLQPLLHFNLVVTLHGGDVDAEPFKNRFNRWLFCALIDCAARVTAVSHVLLEQAIALAPEISKKARVIYGGVAVEEFMHPAPSTARQPYLFAVGALERHKGFDVLVDAFARVCEVQPAVELVIAGTGSERADLEKRIRDKALEGRVRLVGQTSHTDIAMWMCGSIGVIVPSRREPFGLVGIEGMASGRALIVSRVGGLVEALAGADTAWFEPEDVTGLAAQLEHLLNHRSAWSLVRTDNQLRATEFAWDKIAAQYLALYNEVSPFQKTTNPVGHPAEQGME